MKPTGGTVSTEQQVRVRSRLEEIADALGTTPDVLIEDAVSERFSDPTAEFIFRWMRLTDPNDQQLVLEMLRRLGPREG